jgi:Ser/Thr protein kinase RdoA (MazF antagonist)
MNSQLPDFDLLAPEAILEAVERAHELRLDGTLQRYPSYINRVYGLRSDEGHDYIAKFYRPARWSMSAIREEHLFLADCRDAEIPVVAPLHDPDGDSLAEVEIEDGDRSVTYVFSLFPKRGGRNFDAEGDEEWFRLGSVVGRIHAVARRREAQHRHLCHPRKWVRPLWQELLATGVVHPDLRDELNELVLSVLDEITPLFAGASMHRIHGDCHRGNLLERPGEGLLVIDFDDMMLGPAVQDLWLLLPGHRDEVGREITMLLEGYETFAEFDRRELRLVEPLRFMRMVHFLVWQGRQRADHDFAERFPWWGSREFWVRELEDLRTQAAVVEAEVKSELGGRLDDAGGPGAPHGE